MHTIWCVLLLESLLFIKIIEGLNYADFGLPNSNPCIFTSNQTVYIINEQSLSITFDQASWDTITPQIIEHNLTTVAACPITRSDKLILIPLLLQQRQQQGQQQQQPLQAIDNITSNSWTTNNNITYLGPQNAVDTFMTEATHFSTTTFNDFIMIFGGNESSTFILDTRYSTLYSWYQIPLQPTTPPSSPDSVLYATSRWVLHFRVEINIAYIDLFDPISFQWYGTISSIELLNTTTKKNIQVLPLINNNTSDSLLIINIIQDTIDSSGNSSYQTTRTTTEFWRLDISTWIPDTLTLTKLNTLFQQSSTISTGGGSVIVTPVNGEIALFYGGNERLAFLDTTNLTFISPPQWITTIDNTSLISQNNNLAIILGSVLGGLFFIVLIILFIWFYKKKRSSSVPLRPNNNNNEKPSLLQKNKWPLKSKRPEKENMITTSRAFEESPPLSEFTLSPIKRLSPLELFYPSSAALSTLPDAPEDEIIVLPQQQQQQQQQQNIKKSRFREHFDFHSFPQDTTITPSKSLPLASSSTTITSQPQLHIPRSSSSYV
ncbi:hypothetical protein EDC94DRAFT_614999 [Helicostylum pulchrum]|nr:hypothetical protein EDC94DRAFT_614999 [Helicostylum pulchrum]